MTATTAVQPRRLNTRTGETTPYYWLTRGGVLRAEWVKLRTLRSTWWVVGSTVAVMGLMGFLSTLSLTDAFDRDGAAVLADFSPTASVTSGVGFAQLVVIVLGVMAVTADYSSGAIRTTFAAVPARTPVLVAKSVVVGVVTFVTGLLGVALAWATTLPMLDSRGLALDLGTWDVARPMLGVPLFLALLALTSLAAGTLLRHTAGAIFSMVALVLVLGGVLSLIDNTIVHTVVEYMPPNTGGAFMGDTVLRDPPNNPDPGVGLVASVLWAVLPLVAAGVVLRRRDA